MDFTFSCYEKLLQLLVQQGYQFADYHSWEQMRRPVILRHDIDYDLPKALGIAETEAAFGAGGQARSTYFVLLSSDFYNVFSRKGRLLMRRISSMGHEIGLHFDEMQYPDAAGDMDKIRRLILKEADALSDAAGCPVTAVSMHRPSRAVLQADLEIPGMVNSYSRTFFHDFKYLSDSRRRWREPVEQAVCSGAYEKPHILTHAFWYFDREETLHDTVEKFVNGACSRCYQAFSENFTDLASVMGPEEALMR